MEHADALEQIEVAAAEPDGLERLMAGDTPEAAAVAGHLAGCPACVAELAAIRRTADLAREAIGAGPDPALRDRTLAYVRGVGRVRTADAVSGPASPGSVVPIASIAAPTNVPSSPVTTDPAPPAPVALPDPVAVAPGARTRRPPFVQLVGLAAAILVAATIGFTAGGAAQQQAVHESEAGIAVLEHTATAALRVAAQPDARQVALTATPAGGDALGSLTFSPSSGELVVVASGLAHEGKDQEYGCWVEVAGVKYRLGKMYWGGDIASWAGVAAGLADVPPDAVFGVSLGPVGGGSSAVPVLTGQS